MAEEWCDFSDLPQATCAHCKGVTLVEPETFYAVMDRAIQAQYGGVCGHCGAHYAVGDMITKAAPDDGSEGVWCIVTHVDNSRW